MSLLRSIKQLFLGGAKHLSASGEERYDNVRVVSLADGTVIEGHEAVEAYFERERKMEEEHGASIIFQVFRLDLQAHTFEEFMSEQLAEIKVDDDFVAGKDTVAAVKAKLWSILEERARDRLEDREEPGLQISEEDQITFFFNRHPMKNHRLFYADHYMLLPVWVQVYLHDCDFCTVAKRVAELRDANPS